MKMRSRPLPSCKLRGRAFIPTYAQVAAAVGRYFVRVADPFETLRVKTVGEAVAVALGARWSPTVGQMVRRALLEMGCELVTFEHKHLVKNIRARHHDRADAVALAMKLRGRKNAPKDAARVEG